MRKALSIFLSTLLVLGPMLFAPPAMAQSPLAKVGGKTYASAYANWRAQIASGSAVTTGTATIAVAPGIPVNPDGSQVVNAFVSPGGGIYTPIIVGLGTANQETVTPTAVSGCNSSASSPASCMITAAFANTHGPGDIIVSGDAGIQEAINATPKGVIVVDNAAGATDANIAGVTVAPLVSIEDDRSGPSRYWNATPTGLALAAPTLPAINIAGQAACDATHQMCSDAGVAGSASWGGTVYACWTYVDIFGNEGPCSATTSWTSVASKAIDLGIPAASAGAVGAVPYLSLSGGTYALAYQIPVTSTVCTMTTLETVTPACAVKNTTYGQAGSTYGADALFTSGGAQITTYPVNTSMVAPVLATTAVTLTAQHPMTNSSVTYAYAPGSRVGACPGISSANMVQYSAAGGINGSSATTVPNPISSWAIPSGCFNQIGAEFRVSGKWTYTDGGDTSTRIIVAWDANTTDTASVPTPLCNMLDTATGTGAAYNGTYTCTVRILTTGATGTAMVNGYSTQNLAAGATTLVRNTADVAVAASGSIDLATNGRIVVWFEGVGATNNPGAQALEATLELLN